MANLPSPFDSDPQVFMAGVTMTRKLLDEGKVRLKSSPAANISYRVAPADLATAAEAHGMRLPAARSILDEISAMASLILRRKERRFIEDIVEQASSETRTPLSDEEKSQIVSALREKIHIVETQLVTERVKEKFHATRASKHETLVAIRWEVTDRKYDSNEGESARGPRALVRFDVASRPEIEIFSLATGLDASQRRSFLIECDEEDLEDLIATLAEAKQRLTQERSH